MRSWSTTSVDLEMSRDEDGECHTMHFRRRKEVFDATVRVLILMWGRERCECGGNCVHRGLPLRTHTDLLMLRAARSAPFTFQLLSRALAY